MPRVGMPGRARRRATVRAGAALLACSVIGAAMAQAESEPPARFDLAGGGAWVASSTVGQLTLIDGGTAEVAARVAVGPPGRDLRSVQSGTVGYALDRALGTVRRVDPATFVAAPPVAVIEGAPGELAVHPRGDTMYVVDGERGRVAVTDSVSVSVLRGEVQSLAEPVASSVVDGDGRLWALGASTGDLTWFDGTERSERRQAVADPAAAELVVVDGVAAVVERAGRSVRALDGDGSFGDDACLEIDPADPSVKVGGSDGDHRIYVVSGEDGVLRVSDLGSGACGEVAIDVAAPDSDLGTPQEAQDRVFVPDYTRGRVAIVDLDTREVTYTGELVTAGTRFELFDEDGIVFYNDPGSERAGVVRIDGTYAAVEKYDPDQPGNGVEPEDGRDHPPAPDAGEDGSGEGRDEAAAEDEPGADQTPNEPGGSDDPADDPAVADGSGAGDDGVPPDAGGPADPGADPAAGLAPAGGPPGVPGTPPPGGPGGPAPEDTGSRLAIFGPAATEIGDPITLQVRPVDPDDTVSGVRWTFGDGDTGTGTEVDHAWDRAGRFQVTVEGTLGSGGPVATALVTIDVVEPLPDPPEAFFTASATRVRVGDSVTFSNQSRNNPTEWSWTFAGADGPGTSSLPTPPPQRWTSPGTYTVELTVRRGDDEDSFSLAITVDPALPAFPALSAITSTPGGPYDTLTTYQFRADASGPVTSCEWILSRDSLDPTTVGCQVTPTGQGTRLTASVRFPSDSVNLVEVSVTGPGGSDREPLPVVVSTPVRPVPAITVAGATFSGGVYQARTDASVTFTAGVTGDYRVLEWHDDVSGTTVEGPAWSPALSAGRHTITLTAVSDLYGRVPTSVTVDVRQPDTPPEVRALAGPALVFGLGAEARDPETGIVWVEVYAHVIGTCIVDGVETPYDRNFSSTPVGVATAPFDGISPDGTIAETTGPDGTVSVIVTYPFCPQGAEWGPVSFVEVWAVAENGDGVRATSSRVGF
ncbi:MAG TPA: PKD domain-containing protein [Acidimicrobiales bacterium]|nr:PKD domain-containing protein [Acidimicrobiales bacterium]